MLYRDNEYENVLVETNIAFSAFTNDAGQTESLALDIYRAEGLPEGPHPAILWVHGGGFVLGNDKTQRYIVEMCNRFARKGYVCVSSDYRLHDRKKGPLTDEAKKNAVADTCVALDWLRANGPSFGIDSTRICVAGGSAGGMIITNMIFGDGSWGKPASLSGVRAVVNLWGSPAQFSPGKPQEWPPALLFHGDADQTVPFTNALEVSAALKNVGCDCMLFPLKDAAHTCMNFADQIEAIAATFLLWHMK